jgi:hypothetical protein
MPWNFVEKGHWLAQAPLEKGWAAIGRDGTLTFTATDLRNIEAESVCAVVVDPDTIRVAVRRPKEHEIARAMTVSIVRGHKNRDTGRRAVHGIRAFKALGIDPKTCAGRVELTIKGDDLLILNLGQFALGKPGEDDDERR